MESFFTPKAYLIARPSLNAEGVAMFLKDHNYEWQIQDTPSDGDLLPEFCGRMCYCSFGKKQGRKTNHEYMKNIIEMGHGSVIEHANYTILFAHVSRGFTHEMVRHRAGFAYSQESTHYIDYTPETFKGYIPKDLDNGIWEMNENVMKIAVEGYKHTYNALTKKGMKKKEACAIARQLLPTGTEAKLAVTGNVRAWRHFMETRGNKHNVPEIRDAAICVFDILINECPNLLYGITKIQEDDGKWSIASSFRKI